MNPPEADTPANRRTAAKYRWLAKCKADPVKAQHLKDLRKAYYESHKEEERAKALARYYRRKAQAQANPPASEPADPPAYPPGVPLV